MAWELLLDSWLFVAMSAFLKGMSNDGDRLAGMGTVRFRLAE